MEPTYQYLNVLNVAKAWRRANRAGRTGTARIHLMRLAAAVDVLEARQKAVRDGRAEKLPFPENTPIMKQLRSLPAKARSRLRVLKGGK